MREFIESTLNWDVFSFEMTIIFIVLIMVIGLGICVWSIDRDNEKLEKLIEQMIDQKFNFDHDECGKDIFDVENKE